MSLNYTLAEGDSPLLADTSKEPHGASDAAQLYVAQEHRVLLPAVAIDCLHGSRRSVAVLMSTFAFVAAIALTLIILLFHTVPVESPTLTLVVAPPSTGVFGVALTTFAARLTKGQTPITGVTVTTKVRPIDPMPLVATLNSANDPVTLRTVKCLDDLYGLDPLYLSQNAGLCGDHNVYNNEVATDGDGFATFANMYVTNGAPQNYALTVSVGAPYNLDMQQEISFAGPLPTLRLTAPVSAIANPNGPGTVITGTVHITWLTSASIVSGDGSTAASSGDGSTAASSGGPAESEASEASSGSDANVPPAPSGNGSDASDVITAARYFKPMSSSSDGFGGSSASFNFFTLADIFGSGFRGLEVTAIPLDLSGQPVYRGWYSDVPSFPSLYQLSNISSTLSLVDISQEYMTSIANFSIVVESSSAFTASLGIFFLGTVMPLTQFYTNGTSPVFVVMTPSFVTYSILSVALTSAQTVLMETSPLTVTVVVSSIAPRVEGVYFFIAPVVASFTAGSPNVTLPQQQGLNSIRGSPAVYPKILLTHFYQTDATGKLASADLLFSLDGGVGQYNIFAVCMGIVSPPLTVTINTSVVPANSRLFATYAPWVNGSAGGNISLVEKVGMPFATVPQMFLRNVTRGAISHKLVTAFCPTLPQLVVPDTFSNANGVAIMAGLSVTSLSLTTPVVQAHNITFAVDGVPLGHLTVLVDSTVDLVSQAQATSCVVELLPSTNQSSRIAVANKVLPLLYRVLDIQGNPVPYQTVTFSTEYTAAASLQGSAPPIAQSMLTRGGNPAAQSLQLATDGNGLIDFAVWQVAPTPDVVLSSTDKKNAFLTISASCDYDAFVTNAPTLIVALPLYNPVRDITCVNSTFGNLSATADIDWTLQGLASVTVTWEVTLQDSRLNILTGPSFQGSAYAVFPPGSSSSDVVNITLLLPSYLEGDLLLVSGVFRSLNSLIELTVPPTVGSLEIVEDIVVTGVGAPATPPAVKVFDTRGNLLVNAGVALQMILPRQNNRSLDFSAKDLAIGFVFPLYSGTVADGVANFTGPSAVSLLGYPPNEEFSFQFVSGLTAVRSRNIFTLQTTLGVEACDAAMLAAAPYVPGEELPAVCLNVQTLPNTTTVVPVSAKMTSQKFGPATLTPSFLVCDFHPSGRLTCNDSFSLSGLTPPDAYTLTVTVPGAVSSPVPVTVSWAPLELQIIEQPPLNVLVGSTITVVTRAVNGNVPVPSTVVSVRLSPVKAKCNKNFLFSCGSLLGSTYVVTDSSGYANFTITVPEGAEGGYKLTFTVAGGGAAALQGAIASAESISQQFLGPFFDRLAGASLPQWASKLAGLAKFLPSSLKMKFDALLSGISATSVPFKLWNPVATIVIAKRPVFSAATSALPSGFRTLPVLHLLDRNGLFVPNIPVKVVTSSASDCPFTASSTTTVFSNAQGYVYFTNLAIAASAKPGKYYLAFVAYGLTNFSASGSVTVGRVKPPSMSEQMRVLCFVLVAILSPLVVANMPYSSPLWVPLSLAILGVLAYAIVVETKPLLQGNISIYKQTYSFFVASLWLLMVLSVLFLGALRILRWLGMGRTLNREQQLPPGVVIGLHEDEFRMAHGFAYTQWLVTARRAPSDTMEAYKADLNAAIDRSLIPRLQRSKSALVRSLVGSMTVPRYTANTEVPMRPLAIPNTIIATFVPVRYWIALAILFVIYFVAVLLSVYVEQMLYSALGVVVENMNFEATVPMPQGFTNITGAIIQGSVSAAQGPHNFAEPLIEALKFAASIDQRVHFITRLVPLISPTVFSYITTVYIALSQVRDALIGAFITAHIVAALAIAAAVFAMTRQIQACMLSVRRGEYRRLPGLVPALGGEAVIAKKFTINLADDYIGLQVIVYIVQHQLAFWLTVLVYLVLACEFTRSFLISKLLAIVSVSLVVSILRGIATSTLVKKFAASGITVVNNLVYGIWSIFSTVIGTIAAAIATVTRLAKGFGLVIFLFPRIDHGLLPAQFALLDKGFLIFWSMLVVDHAHTSPIVLSFAAILLTDAHLRKLQRPTTGKTSAAGKKEPPLLLVNRESLCGITRMPNLNNMVRQRLTQLLRQGVDYNRHGAPSAALSVPALLALSAPASTLLQPRYFRTARRWWLLYLLHRNPSLQAARKHRLRAKNDEIAGSVSVPPSRMTFADKEMVESAKRLTE